MYSRGPYLWKDVVGEDIPCELDIEKFKKSLTLGVVKDETINNIPRRINKIWLTFLVWILSKNTLHSSWKQVILSRSVIRRTSILI